MADSPFVIEVTQENFYQVVLEGSHQRPVLVDFWADWCAPCRMLTPILEGIAEQMGGALLVAKVDTEAQRDLAAQFGIRSLPTVKLFKNGQPVDEFMGALPESEILAFLDRHVPRESDDLLVQADELLARGEASRAAELVEQARKSDPSNFRAAISSARIKAVLGEFEEAEQILSGLPFEEQDNPEVKALTARMAFDRDAADAPETDALIRRIAENEKDSEARYLLAARKVAEEDYESALEGLYTLLRSDRKYGDDAARKAMVRVFELLGGSGDLVTRYRAKMTNALF